VFPTRRTFLRLGTGGARHCAPPPPLHREVPNWQSVRHAVRLWGQALDAPAPPPPGIHNWLCFRHAERLSGQALYDPPQSIVMSQIGSVSDTQYVSGARHWTRPPPPTWCPKFAVFPKRRVPQGPGTVRFSPPPS